MKTSPISIAVLLIACALAGCARTPKSDPVFQTYNTAPSRTPRPVEPRADAEKAAAIAVAEPASSAPSTPAMPAEPVESKPTEAPIVTLAEGITGKVSSVNGNLKFVVLTFPVGQMARVDQRLNVYREGLKVGELIVTGPRRDESIVADISAGEVQTGDEVRDR